MKKEFIFSEDEKSVTIIQNSKEKSYHIGDVIEVNWNKEIVCDEDFEEAICNKKHWQITSFNKKNNEVFVFSYIDMYGENYPHFIQININSIKKLIGIAMPVNLNYLNGKHDGSCCIYKNSLIHLDMNKSDKENDIISFYKCGAVGLKQEDCLHMNFTKDELKDIYVYQYYL